MVFASQVRKTIHSISVLDNSYVARYIWVKLRVNMAIGTFGAVACPVLLATKKMMFIAWCSTLRGAPSGNLSSMGVHPSEFEWSGSMRFERSDQLRFVLLVSDEDSRAHQRTEHQAEEAHVEQHEDGAELHLGSI